MRSTAEISSLAAEAYEVVRQRIARGELVLGQAVSRRRLAAELGMSFLPVTEALLRLEFEGLLESRPRAGTRVRIPSSQDVEGNYVVRQALETQAVTGRFAAATSGIGGGNSRRRPRADCRCRARAPRGRQAPYARTIGTLFSASRRGLVAFFPRCPAAEPLLVPYQFVADARPNRVPTTNRSVNIAIAEIDAGIAAARNMSRVDQGCAMNIPPMPGPTMAPMRPTPSPAPMPVERMYVG